ncbi:MAG: hypothetical protein CSA13_01835 [Clostridiales bacterium]|nr:MAG: hypothetical protein CSA13_01835 [Clostridiales bacterium]
MNNKRVLALILMVAVMLMGAGYAMWTEELNVNTTVTSGELDISFQEAEVTTTCKYTESSATISPDGNTLALEASQLYPTASIGYSVQLKNDGTVGALVDENGFKYDMVIQRDFATEQDFNGMTYQELKDALSDRGIELNYDKLANPDFGDNKVLEPEHFKEITLSISMREDATPLEGDIQIFIKPQFKQHTN